MFNNILFYICNLLLRILTKNKKLRITKLIMDNNNYNTIGIQDEKTLVAESKKSFTPKIIHILIAVFAIIILSGFIFVSLSGNTTDNKYTGLKNIPIEEKDLIHIFSGNYDGKSVLITVKKIYQENGKTYMVYDLKCDFIPIASACKCHIDFLNHTFDFSIDEKISKVPLGKGSVHRTSAGKIIFKDETDNAYKIDLVQL